MGIIPEDIYYHFTSSRHVEGCLSEGIKLGSIPYKIDRAIGVLGGYQWLTVSPEFNQSWTVNSTLPYDRTGYRLTVKIPKLRKKNLINWLDYCARKRNDLAKDLNAYGDPENWWLYKGQIKPQYIINCHKRPAIESIDMPDFLIRDKT